MAPGDPERVALVRTSHLGDVVHALPVYHALREVWPRARLAWVIQAEFAELVRGLSGVERVVLFGRRDGWRAWPRLFRELRAFAPELVVDAQGSLKSAAIAACSGARRRVGLARADWRERAGALVANERALPAARNGGTAHAMDRMRALVDALGARAGRALAFRTDPELSEEERARGARLCARLLPDGARNGPPCLLHLARPADVRSWPPERFAALARSLAGAGRAVLVVSGPGEREHGARLQAELGARPGLAHWVGQQGLRELAALFSAAAARGARLVGCDSGPLHLAAACGLSVVMLSGPEDERRTGPWPVPGRAPASSHAVVRARASPPCAPCLSPRCRHAEGPVCMSGIAVESVVAALEPA
jgi:ADP-heptose:LPS heptosyltransferase